MRRQLMIGLSLCLIAERSEAAGFHIDEQDARATGRAGAVTASTNNPSAIYYNPAGLAQLDGIQAAVGASLVSPDAAFVATATEGETRVDLRRFPLPQVYASAKLGNWFAAGVGLYAPFGLAIRWPETSPGRTQVREAELQAPFITPAAAVDLSRWVPGLALGAGVDLVPANVLLKRDIAFGTDIASVALSGDAFGVGARAGITYRSASLPLSLGLTLRSSVALDFEGSANFEAPEQYRAALPPDGDVATHVVLPGSLGLGVAARPLPFWEVEVDVNVRRWSSYDQLDIELPDGSHSVSRRDWTDSVTVRVGTEIAFAEGWAARLGFIWDQTPIPSDTLDFQLPDADRLDVAAGFGGELAPGVRLDLGGLYVLPQFRDTSTADPFEPLVKGRYEVQAWVLSLTLGMTFGAERGQGDPNALPGPLGSAAAQGD
jgi:long-chain fatty acid transport protein